MVDLSGYSGFAKGATPVSHSRNQEFINGLPLDDVKSALTEAGVTLTKKAGNVLSIKFGENTSLSTLTEHKDGLLGLKGVSHVSQASKEITLRANSDDTISNAIREVSAKALTIDDATPAQGVGASLRATLVKADSQNATPSPNALA